MAATAEGDERRWPHASGGAVTDVLGPAVPAGTVVLLRDGISGLEVLMLHRVSKVAFGGMWVFPGGRVEDSDRRAGDPVAQADELAARRAATREAEEECGLVLETEDLVPLSHWLPPVNTRRRYSTWFFLARATDGEVVVDGAEMDDHAWLAPGEVLRRRDRGEVDLVPPTWVTLHDLAAHATVEAALAEAAGRTSLPHFETRLATTPGGAMALWAGDAGHPGGDPEATGGRHRLWMLDEGWRMERTD